MVIHFCNLLMVSVLEKKKNTTRHFSGELICSSFTWKKIHLGNMCAWTRELRFSGEYNVYTRGRKMYGKRKEETLTDGIIIELRQDNKNARKRIKK